MESVAEALARLRELATGAEISLLAERFAAAGHEFALVGGPVRDAFLGRAVTDLDFTTDADPDQILAIVEPIADAHWDIGREFGTIGARLGDAVVEITTYRSDAYDGATRKPAVAFGTSLEEDLAPPRLHDQRDGAAPAGVRARRSVRRGGGPARRGAAHARRPRGVVRRRPAADDARRPVHGAARASGSTTRRRPRRPGWPSRSRSCRASG